VQCKKCGNTSSFLPLDHLYTRCPICCELIAHDFEPVKPMPPFPSNRVLTRETGRRGGNTSIKKRKAAVK